MPNARFIDEPLPQADRDRIARTQDELRRTLAWFDEHYGELQKTYPETWVAFSADGLVATAKTHDELLSHIDRSLIAQGKLYTDYVPAKGVKLML
jgi:hypothetical protein